MASKRVLVVGLGNMGMSHALAYTRIPGVEVVGVCTRHIDQVKLPEALKGAKKFSDFDTALKELKPDIVSINTLPDTHADYAIKAMEAGAHVFVEKPLAESVESAQRVVDTARHHAPVVIDAGCDGLGSEAVELADRTVIVTGRDVEPALARVAAECVARAGASPVVVLNRAPHDQPGLFALPNSPLGARLALGGREARGELGRAIAELADLLVDLP